MYMNRKGIQFSYKDTFRLDSTLSPIILSALLKFDEVTENKDWRGIPGKIMAQLYPEEQFELTDEQMAHASKYWDEVIKKMIYAFDGKNAPKISDYAFKFIHDWRETDKEDLKSLTLTNTNEEEYHRYQKDSQEHRDKVEEGHYLFGKYFDCLWW